MKRVSQETIAKRLGLDRTTVGKVLNEDPNSGIAKETKELIVKEAKKMGYNFLRLCRSHQRKYERFAINKPTRISIIPKGRKKEYTSGKARIRDISEEGVLIDHLKLKNMTLPVNRLKCKFTIGDVPITGKVIRMFPDSPLAVVVVYRKISKETMETTTSSRSNN